VYGGGGQKHAVKIRVSKPEKNLAGNPEQLF